MRTNLHCKVALNDLDSSFEKVFGYSAYAHLFVTRAMRDFLVKEWGLQYVSFPFVRHFTYVQIRGHKVVLHDRPPRHFHRCSPHEIHEVALFDSGYSVIAHTRTAFL